ncbi:MAG: hypothetical protein KJ057_08225 [Phycisphaerae bacterium]|nr:hypothetical protein [Phycisphaerae bacterium]MCL4718443.1 hypothetical protein [Phycisphaerae bacterium]
MRVLRLAAVRRRGGAAARRRGGAAGSLAALVVGSVNLKEVAQNASVSAVGAADFIKLTTGVAFNTSDPVTFNAVVSRVA